jgi:hypothetical protein
MKLSLTVFFSIIGFSAFSQGIQLNSYSLDFKKNQVSSRFCKEVVMRPDGGVDSIYISEGEFNSIGQLVKYTSFFAGKRKLYEERFEYSEGTWPSKSFVSHAFNQWEEVELLHSYNDKGQLIARICPIEIRNFWSKEEYFYDENGRMTKCIRYRNIDGAYDSQELEEYSSTIHSGENSPTFIHDHRGLLINQQLHGTNGNSKSFLLFEYK